MGTRALVGNRARALMISVIALFAVGFVVPAHAAQDPDSGSSAAAASESCTDGIDNDGDGLVDKNDPDCNEGATRACSDGIDNDNDGKIDAADPGCTGPNDNSEFDLCQDGKDNDNDGQIDAADSDCAPGGGGERYYACNDGRDNDGDGAADLNDPGCTSSTDPSEKAACEDGVDNDNDGKIDFPADKGCSSAIDNTEASDGTGPVDTCGDGIDNDGDGQIDNCNEPGEPPVQDTPCADPTDPGILGSGTIAQQAYDGGLSALPIVQDPEADGPISGPIYGGGTGTPIEPLTDEVACAVNLPVADL